MNIKERLDLYNISLRSLRLGEIVLGLTLCHDTILRFFLFSEQYGPQGIFHYELLQNQYPDYPKLSLYYLWDNESFAKFLLLSQALTAFAWAIGKLNQFGSLILYLLVISTLDRNPFLLNAGEDYLKCLLFCLLIPRAFSLRSGWGLALHVQLASLYFFSYLEKAGAAWHSDANALSITLSLDLFKTSLGSFLQMHTEALLKILTIGIVKLELWGGLLLLFLPFLPIPVSKKIKAKKFLLAGFVLFHLGTMLSTGLFSFSLYSIGACLILWPYPGFGSHFHSQIQIGLRNIGVVIAILLLILNISHFGSISLREWSDKVSHTLRLPKGWAMFAPSPRAANQKIRFYSNSGSELSLTNFPNLEPIRNFYWHLPQQGRLVNNVVDYFCRKDTNLKSVKISLEVKFSSALNVNQSYRDTFFKTRDCHEAF